MKYTLGDKIIALAKFGYATNNADQTLMKGIADWARAHTSDWTLSATDPKTGTVDSSWSPNQENWTDVYDFAKSQGYTPLMDYLTKSGYYFSQAAPAVSNVNSTMQASQALATQSANAGTTVPVNDYTNGINSGAATGYNSIPVVSSAGGVGGDNTVNGGGTSSGGTSYDPIAEADKNAADYASMALRAGDTQLQAQIAQAKWAIDNGGIWKTLQPEYQKQLDSALSSLTQIAAVARANVAAQKDSMNAEQAMNYQNALDDLDKNLVASRQRTVEEMNQRGLYFSTVLDSVMGKVEAANASDRAKLGRLNVVELGKIAAQIATLTANVDIQEMQGKAAAVAQYGAAMLNWIAQDEQTKQAAQALMAGLEVQQKGLADTVGMQIFGTVQGIQQQGRVDAAALDTKTWNDWVAGIGQYENQPGGYQTEINNQQTILSDPNATPEQKALAAKKITALQQARAGKLSNDLATFTASLPGTTDYQAQIDYYTKDKVGMADPNAKVKIALLTEARNGKLDDALASWVKTMGQFQGSYQGEINRLMGVQLTVDPLRDKKINFLRAALADQQAAAAVGTGGSSGGYGSGTGTGGTTSDMKLSFANLNEVITSYQSKKSEYDSCSSDGKGGWAKPITVNVNGIVTSSTMTITDAQHNQMKAELDDLFPVYDSARNMEAQAFGTTYLSSVELNRVNQFLDNVKGTVLSHYDPSSSNTIVPDEFKQEALKEYNLYGGQLNEDERSAILYFIQTGMKVIQGWQGG